VITVFNLKDNGLSSERSISSEHIKKNLGVRKLLLDRKIVPENHPPDEDIKKLERMVNSETKSIGKNHYKLT
jgi:DNA-damage-inducible protein D